MIQSKKYIGSKVTVTVDRPLGSKGILSNSGRKIKIVYPVNYGFVQGVIAPYGEEMEAYVLGVFEPVEEITGKCVAVVHKTNNHDKLVVVPDGVKYTDEQIKVLIEFKERNFKFKILK